MKPTSKKISSCILACTIVSCFFLTGCFKKHIESTPRRHRTVYRESVQKPQVVIDHDVAHTKSHSRVIERTYVVDAPASSSAATAQVQEHDLKNEGETIRKQVNEVKASVAKKTADTHHHLQTTLTSVEKFYVQVGAFSDIDNATAVLAGLKKKGYKHSQIIETVKGLYRVQAGAFADELTASEALSELQTEFPSSFILKHATNEK